MSGWFSVKRGITSHAIFKGHPERLAIWLWLLDNAVWKDTPHDVRGKTITIPRGSVCVSERRLAEEVGVGYQVVRTFLTRLKDERMINATVTHGRNIITLCNWEKYQSANGTTNAEPNATPTQKQRTKEQGNNSVSKDTDASASADPVKVIFDAGVKLLSAVGKSEGQARALIGKWRKENSPEAILVALGRAQREGAVDPVSFIEGALRFQAGKRRDDSIPQHGDTRIRSDGKTIRYMDAVTGWVVSHG